MTEIRIKQSGRRLNVFIKGVVLLSITAIIMRTVAIYFNKYLHLRLGADGIGLFTLIMSVYGFALTLATSSVSLASTRLVSESLGKGSGAAVRRAMTCCIVYCLFFGTLSSILLYSLSYPIGRYLLSDVRTVSCLRLLALALPGIALTSAFQGYFTAVRRVEKSALLQIAEQAARIAVTMLLLRFVPQGDLERACLCVIAGGVCSDTLSFLFALTMYRVDMRRHIQHSGELREGTGKALISIALPVALSSYLRSALVTIEHILIPRGMRKLGSSREQALAAYGIVQAMALPVVLFPYALLSPFCSLLIPEIAERRAAGDPEGISRVSGAAFGFVMIFGIGLSGAMSCWSYELGEVIYGSREAANYIKLLAPLVPIMYLDTVTDSILKGMNEQLYTMRINIADAFMSVIIVFFLVPRIGIYGYIAEIFICELINASLSVMKLLSVVRFRPKVFRRGALPLISIITACALARLLSALIPLCANGALALSLHLFATLFIYLFILRFLLLLYDFGEKHKNPG